MGRKTEAYQVKNYISIKGAEPVPVESLTANQHNEVLLSMQDAFMESRGYVRVKDTNVVQAEATIQGVLPMSSI